jgi:hypothetical protein
MNDIYIFLFIVFPLLYNSDGSQEVLRLYNNLTYHLDYICFGLDDKHNIILKKSKRSLIFIFLIFFPQGISISGRSFSRECYSNEFTLLCSFDINSQIDFPLYVLM